MEASSLQNGIGPLQKIVKLPTEWTTCSYTHGRIVYLNHCSKTSHWVPPSEAWICPYGLPYAWEISIDTLGRPYYINHLDQETTYSDPRTDLVFNVPEPREVTIQRHPQLGFGFVAGSEKPVIVRFVTEGGPSVDKLLPGDEIWAVNGEDVREASKDKVVLAVRSCSVLVTLVVCQPRNNESALKSSILSAAKRARLRNNPTRVRFAEGVLVASPPGSPTGKQSCVELMPNVLRVFLENGQSKSFKYDQETTVQDVVHSLKAKLGISRIEYFALTLEHPQGPRSHKLSLLRMDEKLYKIAARPGSQHFRCLFRLSFVPVDPAEFCRQDWVTFQYFYRQCVNDVVHGRFAYEMRYEACLRLAALQIQQCSIDNHGCSPGKISLRAIEKEYGLSTFLPAVLLENVKRKEVRKHLRYYIKRDANKHLSNGASGITTLNHPNSSALSSSNDIHSGIGLNTSPLSLFTPAEAIKIKYVHMLGHLPSFGGRTFFVTFSDTNTDMLLQVSPRTGITVRNAGRNAEPTLSIFFNMISMLKVTSESDVVKKLGITLTGEHPQVLDFLVDKDDISDLVLFLQGYSSLFTQSTLPVDWVESLSDPPVPPYFGLHSVKPVGWNYACKSSVTEKDDSLPQTQQKEMLVDLSHGPPSYQELLERLHTQDSESLSTDQVSATRRESTEVTVDVHATPISITNRVNATDRHHSFTTTKTTESASRQNSTDEFIRKTFLRAKDSVLLRASSAGDPYRARSLSAFGRHFSSERRESISANELSSVSGSDTESLSTPSESPIHRNMRSRPVNLGLLNRCNQSFGLQSPDTIPCSSMAEVELRRIALTLELDGPVLEDVLLMFPDNVCFDNEIIDLTSIPLKTPDESHQESSEVPESVYPPTPYRDDQPVTQFQDVMKRLEFDTKFIEESHLNQTKVIQDESKRSQCSVSARIARPGSAGAFSPSPQRHPSPCTENCARSFEQFLEQCIIPPPPCSKCLENRNRCDNCSSCRSRQLLSSNNRSRLESQLHSINSSSRIRSNSMSCYPNPGSREQSTGSRILNLVNGDVRTISAHNTLLSSTVTSTTSTSNVQKPSGNVKIIPVNAEPCSGSIMPKPSERIEFSSGRNCSTNSQKLSAVVRPNEPLVNGWDHSAGPNAHISGLQNGVASVEVKCQQTRSSTSFGSGFEAISVNPRRIVARVRSVDAHEIIPGSVASSSSMAYSTSNPEHLIWRPSGCSGNGLLQHALALSATRDSCLQSIQRSVAQMARDSGTNIFQSCSAHITELADNIMKQLNELRPNNAAEHQNDIRQKDWLRVVLLTDSQQFATACKCFADSVSDRCNLSEPQLLHCCRKAENFYRSSISFLAGDCYGSIDNAELLASSVRTALLSFAQTVNFVKTAMVNGFQKSFVDQVSIQAGELADKLATVMETAKKI